MSELFGIMRQSNGSALSAESATFASKSCASKLARYITRIPHPAPRENIPPQ